MKRNLCPFLFLVGAAACSVGTIDPLPGTVSLDGPHRPTPIACGVSVSPGKQGPDGALTDGCSTDADCNPGGPYKPGRCISYQGAQHCTFDNCLQDSDCAMDGVCSCQEQTRGRSAIWSGNVCVAANCRSDAECAETHFCSPSRGSESPFSAAYGYFCHTKKDRCGTDSDCRASESCAFDPQAGAWACSDARGAG
jgi:hypothetical protein